MNGCFTARRATLTRVGTQEVFHGHWHDDVAVLDDGRTFTYGHGYVDGADAEAIRKEACGTVAFPRTYATPATTCLVTGLAIADRPSYRCRHA